MKTRQLKITFSGESIIGPGFPDFEQSLEIEDTPESYTKVCSCKHVKKWEFTVSPMYSNIREILDVTSRLLEEAGARFSDVKAIMCLTQIVCDCVRDGIGTEEMSRRLIKNERKGHIEPDVPMLKSMMGIIATEKELRKFWVNGISKCVKEEVLPDLKEYIRQTYK